MPRPRRLRPRALLGLLPLLLGAALALLPPRAAGLTDAEIALFYADGSFAVTQGTEDGKTLHPQLSVAASGDTLTIQANHVPPHATASSYTQPITTYIGDTVSSYAIPNNPAVGTETTCLPTGVLGVAVNGVAIFSAFSRPCTDAVEDEAIGFDSCQGHPQEQGQYRKFYRMMCVCVCSPLLGAIVSLCCSGATTLHCAHSHTHADYHYKAECLKTKDGDEVCKEQKQLLFGVLLDGFPVYNKFDQNGTEITNDQLDECHGYDAHDGVGYRYVVNDEFPYIVGCFKGTPRGQISCHCDGSTGLSTWVIVLLAVLGVAVLVVAGLWCRWGRPSPPCCREKGRVQGQTVKAVELKDEPV